MDAECAFCGRAEPSGRRRIFCTDCDREHRVCLSCLDDVVSTAPDPAAQYGLVVLA